MFKWGNLKQCSFQDCTFMKHCIPRHTSLVITKIYCAKWDPKKKKNRKMMLMVCILLSKRTQDILIVLKRYASYYFFPWKNLNIWSVSYCSLDCKKYAAYFLQIYVHKKTKWTLVCSTHIGTHSYWEGRYFSRCATLMTASWWERFSAVEHMTVKGSVLSVSRCDSGMPRAGNWKLLKMMLKFEPRPRRALHSNIRCPAHGAMLVW